MNNVIRKDTNKKNTSEQEISSSLSPTMSQAAEIFHKLGLKQKEKYFIDQFGTVKGTTGFFDYWFSQGIKDTKSFVTPNGIIVDLCIAYDGGYYEGGNGGDSKNGIIAIIGDEKFSAGWAKYYDTSSNSRIDNPSLDYKEISEINYDEANKTCTVKVKTKSGSTKEIVISLTEGKIHKFDEALIGGLYIPAGVSVDTNSQITSNQLAENLITPEKNKEDKPYSNEEMYDEVFSLYMEEGDTYRAYNLLKDKLVKDPSKHQHNIIKLFEDRFPSVESTSNDPLSSIEPLFALIKNQEVKKELGRKMIDYLIAVPQGYDMRSVNKFMNIVNIVGGNKKAYYQTFFLAHYHQFALVNNSRSSSAGEVFEQYIQNLSKLAQDKPENYKLLYEGYIKRGGIWPMYFGRTKEHSKATLNNVKKFFQEHGITEMDFFPEDYDLSKKGASLTTIVTLVKDGEISQDKAQSIVSKNVEGMKAYLKKENESELFTFYQVLYKNFKLPYDKEYFNDMNITIGQAGEDQANQILKSHANDKNYIRRLLESACEQEDLNSLHTIYKNNLIIYRKYLVAYAALCFKHGDWRFENILEKADFTKEEKRQIIKPTYANGKIHDNDNDLKYLPYVTYDMAIATLRRYLDPEEKKFATYREQYVPKAIIEHSSAIINRQDITASYVQELMIEMHSAKNRTGIYTILKSGGLKVDKTIVSNWIRDALKTGDLDTADELAECSGLDQVWGKHIIIERIKAGKLQYEWKLPDYIKEYKLGSDFHKYGLDLKIKAGNLEDALKYAKEHNVTLTPAQCEAYREVKRKRIEEQKKQEQERKEKEKKEAFERVEKAKTFPAIITEGRYKTDIDYQRDQKFIFFLNNNGLNIASYPLEYHKDIAGKVGAKKEEMLGGGWIKMEETTKTIILYGSSGSYGEVPLEYRKTLYDVMSKSYPEYMISVE